MVVKMKDPVRHEGEITTIDELDKRGLIEFKEVKNFHTGRKSIIAYFADIKGTEEGGQIGKLAYLSRMKKKVEEELNYERIWEEECEGRCAILHLERCPRYENGECKFPETVKAKEIVEGGRE